MKVIAFVLVLAAVLVSYNVISYNIRVHRQHARADSLLEASRYETNNRLIVGNPLARENDTMYATACGYHAGYRNAGYRNVELTVMMQLPSRGEYGYSQMTSLIEAYIIRKMAEDWNEKRDSLAGMYIEAIIRLSDRNFRLDRKTKIAVDFEH